MIKVGHVVNLISGEADGVYKHLEMIFNNYDKNKFEHFLIFQGGKTIENKLKRLNIRFFVVPNLKKKFSLRSFSQLFHIIKKENPSILHAHLIKPYILVGLLNIIFRKSMIFNYHGSFINNDYNTRVEKFLYTFFHRVIELFCPTKIVLVPSSSSKLKLERETKLFRNISYYYNGFDKKSLGETNSNSIQKMIEQFKGDKFFLISVISRINREKRIDRAVEIFEQVHHKFEKCRLFIFGKGEESKKITELIEEKNLNDCIFALGFVENAHAYLSLFNILLITSEREGLPMVLWESIANGIPVISSDVGGIREILETYNCGFVFNKDNTQEAIEKISLLIQNEELRKIMGENGKKIIDEKFNQSNFIQTIEKYYYTLIDE